MYGKNVMQVNSDLFVEVVKEQFKDDEHELFDTVEEMVVNWDQKYERTFISRSYIDFENCKQLCTHGREAYDIVDKHVSYKDMLWVLENHKLFIFDSLQSSEPMTVFERESFSTYRYDKEEMEEAVSILTTLIRASTVELKLLIAQDAFANEIYFILTATQADDVISSYDQSLEIALRKMEI